MQERAGRFFKTDETGELVSEFTTIGKELARLGFPVAAYASFQRPGCLFGEWQEISDTRIEVPPITYTIEMI